MQLDSIDGLLIYMTIIITPTELEKLLETTDASVLSKLNISQPFIFVYNSSFEISNLDPVNNYH